MSLLSDQTDTPQAETQEQVDVASYRRVLANRNFLLLWMAQFISLTVFNAANFGVILLVNEMTHSIFMAGLAIIAFTLPAVPFSAIAGVVVDRVDKRNVMWVSNLLRMSTMLLIFFSLLVDRSNLWPLFFLTFTTSVIGQFFVPAEGSAIPLLVGERELMPALSLFNISLTLSQALGFLVLGRVVATLFPPFDVHLGIVAFHVESIDMLFVVTACFYALCALLILAIPAKALAEAHVQQHKKEDAPTAIGKALEDLWYDLVAGWRLVRLDHQLFFAVILLSVGNVLMFLIGEVAGAFVERFLQRPTQDMSIIMAPAAVGLVGAALLMPRISSRVGKVRLTFIGFSALTLGFALLPIMHWLALAIDPKRGATTPWFFLFTILVVFVVGMAMAVVTIPTQTMMQERAPESGRARVLSFQLMLNNAGSIPVLLITGVFAQFIDFSQLLLGIAGGMLFCCWWGIWYARKYAIHDKKA